MELELSGGVCDGQEVSLDCSRGYTRLGRFSGTCGCALRPAENWLATTVKAGGRAP